jgi:hypothetical protein
VLVFATKRVFRVNWYLLFDMILERTSQTFRSEDAGGFNSLVCPILSLKDPTWSVQKIRDTAKKNTMIVCPDYPFLCHMRVI